MVKGYVKLLKGVRTLYIPVKVHGIGSKTVKSLGFKIDTGAIITVMGINRLIESGLSRDKIKGKGIVKKFITASGDALYAIQFPVQTLEIGDVFVTLPYVFIPIKISDSDGEKLYYEFTSKDKLLLGTDVLYHLNYEVDADNDMFMCEMRKTKSELLNYDIFQTISEIEELEVEAECKSDMELSKVTIF